MIFTSPDIPRKTIRILLLLNAGFALFFIVIGEGQTGGLLILAGLGATVMGLATGIFVTVRSWSWRLVPGIVGCLLFLGWWGWAIISEIQTHR